MGVRPSHRARHSALAPGPQSMLSSCAQPRLVADTCARYLCPIYARLDSYGRRPRPQTTDMASMHRIRLTATRRQAWTVEAMTALAPTLADRPGSNGHTSPPVHHAPREWREQGDEGCVWQGRPNGRAPKVPDRPPGTRAPKMPDRPPGPTARRDRPPDPAYSLPNQNTRFHSSPWTCCR